MRGTYGDRGERQRERERESERERERERPPFSLSHKPFELLVSKAAGPTNTTVVFHALAFKVRRHSTWDPRLSSVGNLRPPAFFGFDP